MAEATVEAMAAAIRSSTAIADVRADYLRWLAAHGVEAPDAETLAASGGERMLVYRSLVHNRLVAAIREFIPRAAARRVRPELREDFAACMDACGPKSPYLRDVQGEFVAWVATRWASDPALPPYLHDLARHELLELDHTDVVDGGVAHLKDLTALRVLRLDATLITDQSLQYLRGMERLEQLNLADTVVSADGAAQLLSLPALRAVNLARTRATGE